ncbi:MAG TPA: TolC family protein, partial [Anaeromyxobacteraceae bacterium]|nr:TolC family protein [Anaeromyxobacteraceae bacterium]
MSPSYRTARVAVLLTVAAMGGPAVAQPASERPAAELEAELAREVRPETLLELARLRNPDVAEARLRADAAAARADAAGQLPPPELQGELREQALDRPLSIKEGGGMLMLGVRQTLPPGLGARRDAARA